MQSLPLFKSTSDVSVIAEAHENLAYFFSKRIKILIVEDDKNILAYLEGFFSTPYIQVETAATAEDAFSIISSSVGMPWHCWIVDLGLGTRSGLDIVESNRQFPFTIIHSGIGSMEIAAKAIKLGAAEVIDKKPDSIFKLIMKVCKLVPLSFLCKGFLPKNTSVFFLLKENILRNHLDWANTANLSLRQLQNICSMHTGISPTYVLPFYYGMHYLLLKSFGNDTFPIEYSSHHSFFFNCLQFVENNLPYYQNFL
jgi:CheY-like chemotaxis protein